MWCIGTLTKEYRLRMYDLLASYAEPLRISEPVVCIDEKSLQLLSHSRAPLPMGSHNPAKVDYEYVRKATDLFVAIEPKAGKRTVSVTEHRGKTDFVAFIDDLLTSTYANARRLHLVLDNLNIHFRKSFVDVLGKRAATRLLRRVEFHHTPKHASWLNMGRNRDRHPHAPVPGSPHPQRVRVAARGRRLAIRPQHAWAHHRVEVHSSRRRPEAGPYVPILAC